MRNLITIAYLFFAVCSVACSQSLVENMLKRNDLNRSYKTYLEDVKTDTNDLLNAIQSMAVTERKEYVLNFAAAIKQEIASRTPLENATLGEREADHKQLSACCYIAAENKYTEIIGVLGDNMLMSFHWLNAYNPFIRNKAKVQKKLEDYPVLYVWSKDKKAALPYLEKNLFREDINSFNKVISFFLIQKTNSSYSEELYPVLYSQLDEYGQRLLPIAAGNPDVEPWELETKFSQELNKDSKLYKRKMESQKKKAEK